MTGASDPDRPDVDRFREVRRISERAFELTSSERDRFVADACAEDTLLLQVRACRAVELHPLTQTEPTDSMIRAQEASGHRLDDVCDRDGSRRAFEALRHLDRDENAERELLLAHEANQADERDDHNAIWPIVELTRLYRDQHRREEFDQWNALLRDRAPKPGR